MGPGTDAVEGGAEAGSAQRAKLTALYHTPADSFDDSWNFEALLQDVKLHFNVIRALADSEMRG